MKHLQQPKGSNSCGQHVLAMFTGFSVSDICGILNKRGCTNTKDLVKVLRKFRHKCPNKLIRLPKWNGISIIPSVCVLKVKFKYSTHWVLKYGRSIYDPALPYNLSISDWIFAIKADGHVTSYLPII